MGGLDRHNHHCNMGNFPSNLGGNEAEVRSMIKFIKRNRNAALATIFVVIPVSWMLLNRSDPVMIIKSELKEEVMKPCDVATIQWTVFARRSCAGSVSRRVIGNDGIIHDYESINTVIHEIGKTNISARICQEY
jgi:hypothetical protein